MLPLAPPPLLPPLVPLAPPPPLLMRGLLQALIQALAMVRLLQAAEPGGAC